MTFTRNIFILSAGLLTLSAVAQEAETNTLQGSSLIVSDRTDEERIRFLLDVAEVYFEEEDFQSAMGAYERILEIDPTHLEARYIVAHVYISAKAYAKAETLLLQLIEDNPEDFKLMNNLAWLYATAEDPKFRSGKKAVRYAQMALVLAPNDHHVWSTLSEARYINGDYEKAYNAITTMATLAQKYGKGLTQEQVDAYNEQILKCKRAWDTQKMLEEDE